MSPGPCTSAARGGSNFRHSRTFLPLNRAFTAPGRTYSAPRGRFSVSPGANGSTQIALDENETVTVGQDPETGGVTVHVSPKPENGNLKAGLLGRLRQRMSAYAGSDGEIILRPDGDNSLQLLGDPESGAIAVIELEPAPGGNGPNGE